MMRAETETFGVSMSTECVRGVIVDGAGRVVEVRSTPTGTAHPLAEASIAAIDMAAGLGLGHEAPVLAVGGDPVEVYGPGGVRLVGECDAFLAAARVDGCIDFARTVAIVDLGRVGTRVHLLDASTGQLFSSVGTADLSGDAIDAAVADHLAATFGAAEKMSPAALAGLARDSVVAKEMLSDERVIDMSGPFVTESVRLRRTDLEHLVAPMLTAVLGLAGDAVTQGADAVLLVGGGANIPFVHRAMTDTLAVPVVVPVHPQYFSAMGAAHLSTVVPPAPAGTVLPSVVVPAVAPVENTDFPADDTPTIASMPTTSAVPRRRGSRVGVVVGTAALLVAVTLAAGAAASGRSEAEDVRGTDRVVVTSSVTVAPSDGGDRVQPVAVTQDGTPVDPTASASSGDRPAEADALPPGAESPGTQSTTTSVTDAPMPRSTVASSGMDTSPTTTRRTAAEATSPPANPPATTPRPVTTTPRPVTTTPRPVTTTRPPTTTRHHHHDHDDDDDDDDDD